MQPPRYQIFVSSTFRDLREERQAVLDAILELNHFPAGMEIFPAADSTPWELIERIIQQSDYYVLIMGGVYGSTDEEGVSYTEREYDLARKLGKPVLAFLHASPDLIPAGKSEVDAKARKKLAGFRKKAQGHHCKFWKDSGDLKAKLIVGLMWAITSKPAVGYVRADGVDNTELLTRLADLQARHDALLEENKQLHETTRESAATRDLAFGTEKTNVRFTLGDRNQAEQIELAWEEIFFGIAADLMVPSTKNGIQYAIGKIAFGAFHGTKRYEELIQGSSKPTASDSLATEKSAVAIMMQFAALGLVESAVITIQPPTFPGSRVIESSYQVPGWKLSPAGLQRLAFAKAVRVTKA